jgi:hypothetical protein
LNAFCPNLRPKRVTNESPASDSESLICEKPADQAAPSIAVVENTPSWIQSQTRCFFVSCQSVFMNIDAQTGRRS